MSRHAATHGLEVHATRATRSAASYQWHSNIDVIAGETYGQTHSKAR
jgi:hypothetical protein